MLKKILSQKPSAPFLSNYSVNKFIPREPLPTNYRLFRNLGASLFSSVLSYLTFSLQKESIFATTKDPREAYLKNPLKLEDLETFTNEKYEEAIKSKYDVIIFVDPDKYVDFLVNDILQRLTFLENFQQRVHGRKVKFFAFRPQNLEDIKNFQEKYEIEMRDETILLLRNKYFKKFYQYEASHHFGKSEILVKYFRKITKLSAKTYPEFSGGVKYLNNEARIIATYVTKDSPNFKKVRNRFAVLSMDPTYLENTDVHFLIITDPKYAQELKIPTEKEGELFILSKSSKYNAHNIMTTLNNTNLFYSKSEKDIFNSLDDITTSLALTHKKSFIFTSQSFDQIPSRYSLVLEVDQNKISKVEYNRLVDLFSQVHDSFIKKEITLGNQVTLVKLNRTMKKSKGYRIFIRDEESIIKEFSAAERTTILDTINPETEYKPHSYIYKFGKNRVLDKDSLIEFVKETKEDKVKEWFKSQKPEEYPHYSKKIVGKTFKKQILENDKHNIIFFHSKRCHSCKQFGRFFEQMALENLKIENSNIEYSRMDSDHNQLDCFYNYHYTPVFMVLRKDHKKMPFVYRQQRFTPQMFSEFVQLTLQPSLIDNQTIQKAIEEWEKNQDILKELRSALSPLSG